MSMPGRTRTALVTGASAGIGAAFARVLAEHASTWSWTARRLDRLEALATELSRRHGVSARVVAANLADPERQRRSRRTWGRPASTSTLSSTTPATA